MRLALLSCAGLVAAGAAAQPVSLDERGLDGVTASTAGRLGAVVAGSGVVVEGGAVYESGSVVALESRAQSDTSALNLVNAVNSDAGQGVNIFDSRAGTVAGDAERQVAQSNLVLQSDEFVATLDRLVAPAAVIERFEQATESFSESSLRQRHVVDIDRTVISEQVTTRFQADVAPEFVGIFDNGVSLGQQSIGPLVTFVINPPPFRLKFSVVDLPGEFFDVDINIPDFNLPALSFSGATIELADVRLEGNDIVLVAPTLRLPRINYFECFLDGRGCDDTEKKSSETRISIGGNSIPLSLDNEIRLEGVNPLGDLGVTFGYAIAGDGTVTFSAGGLDVVGAIPIDLNAIADLAIDLTLPDIGPIDDFVGNLVGTIDLPSFEIPIDLSVDFPEPAFADRQFGGNACVYDGNQEICQPLDRRIERTEVRSQSHEDTDITESSDSEAHFYVTYERSRGELIVEEGQADLIVLRNSGAEDTRYRLVIVEGEAQSGIRALNTVNAAVAIIGTGLNLSTERAGTLSTSAGPGSSISQTNSFRQIGGL